MKIAIASDVHLEFGALNLENPGVDVLIMSGDICVVADLRENEPYAQVNPKKAKKIHDFFKNVSDNFPHVVYVAGNHEHYNYDFQHTLKDLKRHLEYLPNIHVLDKEYWDFSDKVRFFGGTLWTDMNKEDPLTLSHVSRRMNDFMLVKNSATYVYQTVPIYETDENGSTVHNENGQPIQISTKRKQYASTFTPEDAVVDHKLMMEALTKAYDDLSEGMDIVVVGHHAPSKASTHPRYAHEMIMNGAYSSDLSEFILDRPKIKLWTHGHTHEDFDYMIGSTRIVCNPRGYDGYEKRADNFTLKVIEL